MTQGHPAAAEKSGDWLKIEISAPPEMVDALYNFVTEIGAEGAFQETLEPGPANGSPACISADPAGDLQDHRDPPDVSPAAAPAERLKAFLPFDPHLEQRLAQLQLYIDSLTELFPELERPVFRTEVIVDPDWGEAWKKYFKPLWASRNIVIKPTWEPFTPSGREIVIEIDPGMAFGTGQHPSTRMCLEALDTILRPEKLSPRLSVLDVGTGTGILAIAAAKLGAAKVLGIDNDGQAAAIARENVRINQVGGLVTISDRDIAELAGPFDLVVANLTARPLIELYPDLLRLLLPGGRLVISGIIEQNRAEIESRFLGGPFPTHSVQAEKEWLCYLLQKAGERP